MITRCLSLHQPFATLLAVGEKTLETRGWQTRFRGPLFVHASRQRAELAVCERPTIAAALARHGYYRPSDLPQSCVLATARVVDCHPVEFRGFIETPDGRTTVPTVRIGGRDIVVPYHEQSFGDFRPGRWAWRLEGVMCLETPVDCPGRQGLWVPSAELEELVYSSAAVSSWPPAPMFQAPARTKEQRELDDRLDAATREAIHALEEGRDVVIKDGDRVLDVIRAPRGGR